MKFTLLVPDNEYIVPAGAERVDLTRWRSNDELEAKAVKEIKTEMDAQVAKLMGPAIPASPISSGQDARIRHTHQYTYNDMQSMSMPHHAIRVYATRHITHVIVYVLICAYQLMSHLYASQLPAHTSTHRTHQHASARPHNSGERRVEEDRNASAEVRRARFEGVHWKVLELD